MTGLDSALMAGDCALETVKDAPVHLAIAVRTEPAEVARFSRETGGCETGEGVPLTFPFRWLALPPIRALIVQMTGEGFLPVHEAQSFIYENSLRTGEDYLLSVAIQPTEKPARLTVTMLVTTAQGASCARLESILRIVPLAFDGSS